MKKKLTMLGLLIIVILSVHCNVLAAAKINQLWRKYSLDGGKYALASKCTLGACLDLDQNLAKDNQNVSIYNEHLGKNQKWTFASAKKIDDKKTQTITANSVIKTVGDKSFNLGARASGKLTYKSNNTNQVFADIIEIEEIGIRRDVLYLFDR